jgi:hypothetical protein
VNFDARTRAYGGHREIASDAGNAPASSRSGSLTGDRAPGDGRPGAGKRARGDAIAGIRPIGPRANRSSWKSAAAQELAKQRAELVVGAARVDGATTCEHR